MIFSRSDECLISPGAKRANEGAQGSKVTEHWANLLPLTPVCLRVRSGVEEYMTCRSHDGRSVGQTGSGCSCFLWLLVGPKPVRPEQPEQEALR